jgi:broad specificity phosphatase PhoE
MACVNEVKTLPGNTLLVSHDYVGRVIMVAKHGLPPEMFYTASQFPNAEIIEIRLELPGVDANQA